MVVLSKLADRDSIQQQPRAGHDSGLQPRRGRRAARQAGRRLPARRRLTHAEQEHRLAVLHYVLETLKMQLQVVNI